eukprot:535666_1
MADKCLFEMRGSGTYLECLWISGIVIALVLGQFIITAPLMRPIASMLLEMAKERLSLLRQQFNVNNDDNNQQQLSETEQYKLIVKEDKQNLATFWKDYKQQFNVFGFHFSAYIAIVTIACFFVTIGTIFLIYSVDDPRIVWVNEGWKKTVNGSTVLIVFVKGANRIILIVTKKK